MTVLNNKALMKSLFGNRNCDYRVKSVLSALSTAIFLALGLLSGSMWMLCKYLLESLFGGSSRGAQLLLYP